MRQVLEDKTKRAKVLASITALKKLCNHPKVWFNFLLASSRQPSFRFYSEWTIRGTHRYNTDANSSTWITTPPSRGLSVVVSFREKGATCESFAEWSRKSSLTNMLWTCSSSMTVYGLVALKWQALKIV